MFLNSDSLTSDHFDVLSYAPIGIMIKSCVFKLPLAERVKDLLLIEWLIDWLVFSFFSLLESGWKNLQWWILHQKGRGPPREQVNRFALAAMDFWRDVRCRLVIGCYKIEVKMLRTPKGPKMTLIFTILTFRQGLVTWISHRCGFTNLHRIFMFNSFPLELSIHKLDWFEEEKNETDRTKWLRHFDWATRGLPIHTSLVLVI